MAQNESAISLNCLSWNVNGVAKFTALTPELGYLESFDVVLLQETFTTSPENGCELFGFIPFHTLARRTKRRPSCGLTTLLKIDSFAGGTLRSMPSPLDWLQVTRWRRPSDRGILFVNAYVAVHTTGFEVADVRSAISYLETIQADFPSDSLILGGDLNYDPWRTVEHRAAKIQIPQKTRYLNIFN